MLKWFISQRHGFQSTQQMRAVFVYGNVYVRLHIRALSDKDGIGDKHLSNILGKSLLSTEGKTRAEEP